MSRKIFWGAIVVLVFALLWTYVLVLRSQMAEKQEQLVALTSNHDELLRRHRLLVEEAEDLDSRVDDLDRRIGHTQSELEVCEERVEAFKVYQGAWESLHTECLDSLSRCVTSYKNATGGQLDWYNKGE